MIADKCELTHDEIVACDGMSKAARGGDCIDWELTSLGPRFYVCDGSYAGLTIYFCPFCGARLTQRKTS